MTARSFLVRGLLAGLLAGMVAFGVAKTIGEPIVGSAIAYEEQGGGHSGEHGGDGPTAESEPSSSADDSATVSRSSQSTWGLLTGTVLMGIALGGLVGLLSAFAVGRVGSLGPGASSGAVTALAFVALYGVVWFKYPPGPPGIGNDATLGARTAEYFGMILISIALLVLALVITKRVSSLAFPTAGVAGGIVAFVVLAVIAGLLMPPAGRAPSNFPPNTLADFRAASLAIQLSLWTTIGITISVLTDRAFRSTTRAA
ncbi:CbtA family protein [Cumulibacter manganitolerans]|uniref:CbtA family protein n=1 Tax=Cumulibacter manganitolerans TaxID=1884992 RepID=UPI001E540445|nr:CbtA family protein [Cumulibacter manganitolerans]